MVVQKQTFTDDLDKRFGRLGTQGKWSISFLVNLSNHERNPLVQHFSVTLCRKRRHHDHQRSANICKMQSDPPIFQTLECRIKSNLPWRIRGFKSPQAC